VRGLTTLTLMFRMFVFFFCLFVCSCSLCPFLFFVKCNWCIVWILRNDWVIKKTCMWTDYFNHLIGLFINLSLFDSFSFLCLYISYNITLKQLNECTHIHKHHFFCLFLFFCSHSSIIGFFFKCCLSFFFLSLFLIVCSFFLK